MADVQLGGREHDQLQRFCFDGGEIGASGGTDGDVGGDLSPPTHRDVVLDVVEGRRVDLGFGPGADVPVGRAAGLGELTG